MALRHTATWRAALFPAKQYYNSTGPEHHPPLRASRTTKMAKPTRLTPLRHGEGPWYEQTTGGGVITAPLSALEGPPICPDLGLGASRRPGAHHSRPGTSNVPSEDPYTPVWAAHHDHLYCDRNAVVGIPLTESSSLPQQNAHYMYRVTISYFLFYYRSQIILCPCARGISAFD